MKLRIHSHLLFLGLTEPPNLKYWSKVAVASLLKLPMHQATRYTLESYVRELHTITSELSHVEQQLETICRQEEHDKVIKCLRSVPGVGPLIAATFRLKLFQPGGCCVKRRRLGEAPRSPPAKRVSQRQ